MPFPRRVIGSPNLGEGSVKPEQKWTEKYADDHNQDEEFVPSDGNDRPAGKYAGQEERNSNACARFDLNHCSSKVQLTRIKQGTAFRLWE
jgi:hypothetical protein